MIVGSVIVGNDKPKNNTKTEGTSDTKLNRPWFRRHLQAS